MDPQRAVVDPSAQGEHKLVRLSSPHYPLSLRLRPGSRSLRRRRRRRDYDVVMREENLSDAVREIVPPSRRKREYWRSVVRMAALRHALGHLPFSHCAEKELLPDGSNHERKS